MKNVWKWLFIGLLAVGIVTAIVLGVMINSFHEPGINIIGNHALVSLNEECYFIDAGQVVGKSNLILDGYLWDNGGNTMHNFYGVVNLTEYPVCSETSVSPFVGYIDGGDYLELTNQAIVLKNEDWEYYYTIRLFESDPNLAIVLIIKKGESQAIVAVCADSEEQALSNYQLYMDIWKDLLTE